MNDLLKRTTDFLATYFEGVDVEPGEKRYRYEHTLRVANIGRELAISEQADLKVVLLGCLLHDVGKYDTEDGRDHGRVSAKIAREFLKTLPLSEKEINNICYAIAVHVDGQAGYDYEHILEAKIVSDADNIDRFGAYRIYEMMADTVNRSESLDEQKEHLIDRIERLKKYHAKGILETKSGNEWFKAQLELGISFFENYLTQITQTSIPDIKE